MKKMIIFRFILDPNYMIDYKDSYENEDKFYELMKILNISISHILNSKHLMKVFSTLHVKWINKNTIFRINEYDGNEYIEFYSENNYHRG